MTYDARELARVRNPVLLVSAITWIVLLIEPGTQRVSAHCVASMSPPASLGPGWGMGWEMDWALMLVAMMSPVLIPPVRHIRLRSFTHRRARSTALFVVAYAAI